MGPGQLAPTYGKLLSLLRDSVDWGIVLDAWEGLCLQICLMCIMWRSLRWQRYRFIWVCLGYRWVIACLSVSKHVNVVLKLLFEVWGHCLSHSSPQLALKDRSFIVECLVNLIILRGVHGLFVTLDDELVTSRYLLWSILVEIGEFAFTVSSIVSTLTTL